MPNHCSNWFYVQTSDSIECKKQFKDFIKKSVILKEEKDNISLSKKHDNFHGSLYTFTFDGGVPMPKELDVRKGYPPTEEEKKQLKSNIEKYGYETWYEWRLVNWGTKWDAYDYYINEVNDTYFEVSFDTAWSPPTAYYLALSKKYPLLRIEVEYSESGMDFAGRQSYFDGELVDEVEMSCSKYEFIEDPTSWWDRFYDYAQEGLYGTLEDFKDHYSDLWEVMKKGDRLNIKTTLEKYENEEANS
jgi:hypothetical protein